MLEAVTHNAAGRMIDSYTHWEWAPLCEAVSCFPSLLDSDSDSDSLWVDRRFDAASGLQRLDSNQGPGG